MLMPHRRLYSHTLSIYDDLNYSLGNGLPVYEHTVSNEWMAGL
jgi:hypothetical protein